MDPDLKSVSFQLYLHPEVLGPSRSHLGETQLFWFSEGKAGGRGWGGKDTQHLPFLRDQPSQGKGRAAPQEGR